VLFPAIESEEISGDSNRLVQLPKAPQIAAGIQLDSVHFTSLNAVCGEPVAEARGEPTARPSGSVQSIRLFGS
jgi:hypothetical protein